MSESVSIRNLFARGWLLIGLGVGGILLWANLATLESAAIAYGVVEPAGGVHTVQHLEGGIVSEVLVTDGQQVDAGQLLLSLDDTQVRAEFERIRQRLDAARVEAFRLHLELEEKPWQLQAPFDSEDFSELVAIQKKLFDTRRDAYLVQLDILEQKVVELEKEIIGLHEQRAAADRQTEILRERLKDLEQLARKQMATKTERLQLEAAVVEYKGKTGKLDADIARVEQQIGETRLNNTRLKRNLLEKLTAEKDENDKLVADLEQRLTAASDILQRTLITSPSAGTVSELAVRSAGEVIARGQAILKLVPVGAEMIIRARINPDDIDVVKPGLQVDVRLTAYSARRTRPLAGHVEDVSPDRQIGPEGEVFYEARVILDKSAHTVGIEFYPGMSAQLAIVSGSRTVMQYLLDPLYDSLELSLREQ
jgi:HlyD family type I secretion membrane fusion protein